MTPISLLLEDKWFVWEEGSRVSMSGFGFCTKALAAMDQGTSWGEQVTFPPGLQEGAREEGRTEGNYFPQRIPSGRTCLFPEHAWVELCCAPDTGLEARCDYIGSRFRKSRWQDSGSVDEMVQWTKGRDNIKQGWGKQPGLRYLWLEDAIITKTPFWSTHYVQALGGASHKNHLIEFSKNDMDFFSDDCHSAAEGTEAKRSDTVKAWAVVRVAAITPIWAACWMDTCPPTAHEAFSAASASPGSSQLMCQCQCCDVVENTCRDGLAGSFIQKDHPQWDDLKLRKPIIILSG